jgi:hypothetical protein
MQSYYTPTCPEAQSAIWGHLLLLLISIAVFTQGMTSSHRGKRDGHRVGKQGIHPHQASAVSTIGQTNEYG